MKKTKPAKSVKTMDQKIQQLAKNLSTKEGVTALSLKNVYGPHAPPVLWHELDCIEDVPAKGKVGRYRLVKGKALPTSEEFGKALHEKYKTTVSILISDAFSQIEELAGEAREIVDNAGDALANTQRIQTFGETADVLEGISEPEIPDPAGEIEVLRLPYLGNRTGRSHRLDEAVGDLDSARAGIEEWCEDNKEHDEFSDMEELGNTCQETIDEVSGVEFPGMYG